MNSRVRIFDGISKRLIQLRQMIRPWKAYENPLLFMLKVFSNFERSKSDLENGTSSTKFVFLRSNFLTVRPNAANDMALESCCKTAPSTC